MSFLWPVMLLSLLVVPLLVALYARHQRRRRAILARYGTLGVVQAGGRTLGWQRHIPPALLLLGIIFLALGLARPQAVVSLPRLEGTVVLAFDVSGSMAADDLEPSRMEAARVAAMEFVQRQPATVRIGVVTFSDSGFTVLPPTHDQAEVLATLNRMRPERGTSLASGILTALNTLFTDPEQTRYYTNLTPTPAPTFTPVPDGFHHPAAIVLLTDGENTAPPEPLDAAETAADLGVRIYTVGIGSAAGTTLEVEGFLVHTQLDEETLQAIAQITDGAYFNAENEEQLRDVYGNLTPELVARAEDTEVTALFAGAGLLLLLAGGGLSMLWFGRVP